MEEKLIQVHRDLCWSLTGLFGRLRPEYQQGRCYPTNITWLPAEQLVEQPPTSQRVAGSMQSLRSEIPNLENEPEVTQKPGNEDL